MRSTSLKLSSKLCVNIATLLINPIQSLFPPSPLFSVLLIISSLIYPSRISSLLWLIRFLSRSPYYVKFPFSPSPSTFLRNLIRAFEIKPEIALRNLKHSTKGARYEKPAIFRPESDWATRGWSSIVRIQSAKSLIPILGPLHMYWVYVCSYFPRYMHANVGHRAREWEGGARGGGGGQCTLLMAVRGAARQVVVLLQTSRCLCANGSTRDLWRFVFIVLFSRWLTFLSELTKTVAFFFFEF